MPKKSVKGLRLQLLGLLRMPTAPSSWRFPRFLGGSWYFISQLELYLQAKYGSGFRIQGLGYLEPNFKHIQALKGLISAVILGVEVP